jgi:hypothetical protein
MRERSGAKRRKVRGKQTNTQFADGLGDVVRETTRLWRKHHLGYDQTKYVVEQVRCRLTLLPPGSRRRTVNRLDKIEMERLIQNTYQSHSKYGLMIKTLFLSGARVDEFVHIRVEDLHLDGDPPQNPSPPLQEGIEPLHSDSAYPRAGIADASGRPPARLSFRNQSERSLFGPYGAIGRPVPSA